MSNKLAALEYLERGWHPIPVKTDIGGRKPYIRWTEYQKRAPTSIEVVEWWTTWPDAGIALVCGAQSNLVVIDLDERNGADMDLSQWPETYTVETPGGMHLYYTHPGGVVENSVQKIAPGVDVRGDAGFVFAPPTVRSADNGFYKVINDCDLAPVTFDLTGNKPEKVHVPKHDFDFDFAAVARWEDMIEEDCVQGTRQDTLVSIVGYMAQDRVPKARARHLLEKWSAEHCHPPIENREIYDCLDRIYRKELEKIEAQKKEAAEKKEKVKQKAGLTRGREYLAKWKDYTPKWLVTDWVPAESIGFLVSPPECFKSWLSNDIAISIASGRPLFGKYEVPNPGKVFIYQVEDHFGQTAQRYVTQLQELYERDDDSIDELFFSEDRDFHFARQTEVMGLVQAVKEHRPALVIMDPLYSIVTNDHNMELAPKEMKILKHLRDKYGTCFLIVHHTRKEKELNFDRGRVLGSQLLNAFVEYGLQVGKLNDKETVCARHFKMAARPDATKISWVIDTTVESPVYAPIAQDLSSSELESILNDANSLGAAPPIALREEEEDPEAERVARLRDEEDEVMNAIDTEHHDKASIRAFTGLDSDTVVKVLQRLKKRGTVDHMKEGWIRV